MRAERGSILVKQRREKTSRESSCRHMEDVHSATPARPLGTLFLIIWTALFLCLSSETSLNIFFSHRSSTPSAFEVITETRYINYLFTYLLTYSVWVSVIGSLPEASASQRRISEFCCRSPFPVCTFSVTQMVASTRHRFGDFPKHSLFDVFSHRSCSNFRSKLIIFLEMIEKNDR